MANEEQLAILRQGVKVWNKWREENPAFQVDLSNASFRIASYISHDYFAASDSDFGIEDGRRLGMDFRGINLSNASLIGTDFFGADLSEANLSKAILGGANLGRCNLNKASLSGAYLVEADLTLATLKEADCINANLVRAKLNAADFSGADLRQANLMGASLVRTRIDKAKVSRALIYGISVWDLNGEFEEQKDLVITPEKTPIITADNIKA